MDLLILMVLVVVALLTRAVSGNWLAPGPFFCLFWVVNIAVALAAGRSFPVSPTGLWILVSLLTSFAVGSLAFVGQQGVNLQYGDDAQNCHGENDESELIVQ